MRGICRFRAYYYYLWAEKHLIHMKKPNLNLKRASVLTSTLLCSALLIAAPLRRELIEGLKFKQA